MDGFTFVYKKHIKSPYTCTTGVPVEVIRGAESRGYSKSREIWVVRMDFWQQRRGARISAVLRGESMRLKPPGLGLL